MMQPGDEHSNVESKIAELLRRQDIYVTKNAGCLGDRRKRGGGLLHQILVEIEQRYLYWTTRVSSHPPFYARGARAEREYPDRTTFSLMNRTNAFRKIWLSRNEAAQYPVCVTVNVL